MLDIKKSISRLLIWIYFSKAFSYLDVDRKGYLTINDLRHAADNNGLKFSTSDLGDMMLEADTSGTSTVTQQEFINILLMTITTKYYRM